MMSGHHQNPCCKCPLNMKTKNQLVTQRRPWQWNTLSRKTYLLPTILGFWFMGSRASRNGYSAGPGSHLRTPFILELEFFPISVAVYICKDDSKNKKAYGLYGNKVWIQTLYAACPDFKKIAFLCWPSKQTRC